MSLPVVWKVFWDLQCPYSRNNWGKLPAIRQRFESNYTIEVHLTSLLFHPQSFPAQCAANLIHSRLGNEAKTKFVDACFENQERYMNKAVGDSRPSEVDAIFATIAEEAGLFNPQLTKEDFLANLHDWQQAALPAWNEHKVALGYGVYGTPKHVINDKLVEGTDSMWGPDEWAEKLRHLDD